MRIVVLGATGMAGAAVVSEAAGRGHDVTAVSRQQRPQTGNRLTSHLVDVTDVDGVAGLLEECDAAVVAIRPPAGQEGDLAGMTRGVLDAASRSETPLLIVGGAAPLRSPAHPGTLVIDDPTVVPPAWREVARASLEQLRACRDHEYRGWVYLSPPALFGPGTSTGSYRRGTTTLLVDDQGVSRISPEDLARAVVDELEHPGGDQHFTVIASS
ncbi:NAD(P)H-binding protein [Actinomyces sp. ZJ308]|uniref:NAD(P)-dependent oxidoreductase n=1 Tax=Actinomyces sp. ZJ308 TaxID=2708342 RepID=UPI0014244AB3|nr:NAD(P)H-binding protein [Actinomyces sp. ZJ308]